MLKLKRCPLDEGHEYVLGVLFLVLFTLFCIIYYIYLSIYIYIWMYIHRIKSIELVKNSKTITYTRNLYPNENYPLRQYGTISKYKWSSELESLIFCLWLLKFLNYVSKRKELLDIVPSIPEPTSCSKSKSKTFLTLFLFYPWLNTLRLDIHLSFVNYPFYVCKFHHL